MPYLGTPAVDRFTASKTATQFSGNGSAVDFTLDHSVGSPEDILVSVDGVVQEPTVAYGIVGGTTLRFTAAPSSNAGNNIFVYYLFSTLGTVTHPPTSALSATSGTFSGAITGGGLLTTGGNIVIPNAGNIGSASDTDAIAIASNGVVTFSQIPSGNFISHIDQWRLTTTFTDDVAALTDNLERVDTDGGALLGSAMTQSSGVFTFPVTGLWQITFFAYHGSSANNNDARTKISILTTLDNSTYTVASQTSGNTHGTGGAAETGTTTTFVFEVTNVSNDKVKFSVDVFDGGNTSTFGSSVQSLTGFTFIRLGNT